MRPLSQGVGAVSDRDPQACASLRLDDVRQATRVQSSHHVGPVGEHRALVDRAFVGDLTFVDGGRLTEQAQPGNAVGAACGGFGQLIHNGLKLGEHSRGCQHIGQRRASG